MAEICAYFCTNDVPAHWNWLYLFSDKSLVAKIRSGLDQAMVADITIIHSPVPEVKLPDISMAMILLASFGSCAPVQRCCTVSSVLHCTALHCTALHCTALVRRVDLPGADVINGGAKEAAFLCGMVWYGKGGYGMVW
jgi:hypothetical protein